MTLRSHHHTRARGFSLLELIVALGIFMVGAASVFSLFAVGAAAHRRAIDTSNAARAAASIFAELEAKWTLVGDLQKRPAKRAKSSGKSRGKGRRAAVATDDPYPVPVPNERPPWPVPSFPAYVYEVLYTPVDEDEDAVMATVIIYWQRRGENRSAQYQRLLLRRPF